jgi:excisionase family DNA binding protein
MDEPTTTPRTAVSTGALLVTVPVAARMLAVGRSTLYELIGSGRLATVHIGRSVRIPVAELEAFVAERRDGVIKVTGTPARTGPARNGATRTERRTPQCGRAGEASAERPVDHPAESLF